MDVIESCLGIAPVPGLGFAFKVFKSIFASVQEAQGFKEQLIVLSASIAAILKALDRQYRDGKLSEISTRKELDELNELMREISTFTQKQSAYNFLKLMFVKELALSTIDGYRSRLDATVNAFQIAALVNIQHWQTKNDKARISDRAALHARLAQMESNQKLLIEALSIQHSSELALMTTLQRRINDKAPNADPKELEFFSHSLRYLETKTGATVDIQAWTIGPFDVEFGPELGSGGFGRVCKARWNQMDVAVKVMKNSEKISPNAEAIRREVDIWSKLNHPHILQFLGANILDDDPFIVMPLVPNGNILSFIRKHPNSDRLKFIYHISLGLVYLHSKGVVHGDLKGVNVLIGDGEKALLCDFGLSRIKADVNSRSSAESTAVVGSQNWMAPELFQGGRPKAPSDMYSFGMTIYEIYTDEIPLGHLHPATLREVVVNINTRPDRPDETEAPTLTDDVWRLATECWAANPSFRPAAPIICDRLQKLYSSTQGHPAPEPNPDARTQLRLTTAPQSPIQTYPDHPHISPQNPNNDPRNVPAENHLPHISPVKKRNLAGRIFGMHKGNPSTATLPPYSHHEQDPSAQPHPPQATRPVPAQEAIPIDRRNTQPGYTPVVLEPPPPEPRRNPPRRHADTLPSTNHPPAPLAPSASPAIRPSISSTPSAASSSSTPPRGWVSRFIKDAMEKPPKRSLVLENPANAICLTQSPDGKDVIVGLSNGYFESWDGNDGSALFPISEDICRPEIGGIITCMGYIKGPTKDARDTSVYVVGSTTGVVAHHPSMGGFTTKLHGNQDPILCLTENGKEIIVLTKAHELHTWPLRPTYNTRRREDRKLSTTPLERLNSQVCTCGAFSPDSTKVFTGTSDGVLLISDVKTGGVLRRQLAFSTNATWNGPYGSNPSGSTGATTIPSCRYLIASPDGKKVAVSYSNGEIRVWDAKSGEYDIIKPGAPNIELHRRHPFPIAYSSDGSKLAFPDLSVGVANQEKVVEVRDSGSGKQVAVVTLKGCPPAHIQTIDFAVKGKRLILTFKDCKEVLIFVWD